MRKEESDWQELLYTIDFLFALWDTLVISSAKLAQSEVISLTHSRFASA